MTSTTLENLFGPGKWPNSRLGGTLVDSPVNVVAYTKWDNFSNNHSKDPTGPNQNIEKQKS